MCALVPYVSELFTSPTNIVTLNTLGGTSIILIASTLYNIGLTPLLLTHKPRYPVSVLLRKDYYEFTFNFASASLCRTLYKAFRRSLNYFSND